MLHFIFTMLIDLGNSTRVGRFPGTTEAEARVRALATVPAHHQLRVRAVRVLAIEYHEGNAS